ncbi:BREX-3 system P-loop-containing protein BrxF [Syntrophaceticus schinkii]|uniref:AAA ATPase central domain protein n=1 Tax=Syntrophaceticus schinkii TaxID=499207 RepID=A0A0B7MBF7_9FIRM|nr:BREX-3 system P-loop-containing protein BrxF [Syntrophaceticus schinkii]CEO87395.1 AAA ATPase central domain protein [Syntrophaceticus schinkii]
MAVINEFKKSVLTLPDMYYKLLLLVGSSGAGKTAIIKKICIDNKYRYVNFNHALSKKLKDIPIGDRCYSIHDCIDEIAEDNVSDFLVFDNIEIIFSKHLQIEPLRTLKNIAKYRNIIAAWSGSIKDGYLTYAEPWHDDYVRYSLSDLECIYINIERGI